MDITHIGIVPPKRNMIYSYYIYMHVCVTILVRLYLLVHFCLLFLAFIYTYIHALKVKRLVLPTIDLTIMDFSNPIGITHKITIKMVTNIIPLLCY